MVRQVLVTEQVTSDTTSLIKEGQLAFGTHAASFFDNDDGEVLSAIALGAQEIRIVLDELVRGNDLEEIACADGSYSRIPRGTTPDDIARCAGPVDSLLRCDTVCLSPADGSPLGILDADEDGAADDMRMIDYNPDDNITELAVAIICDGVDIPLDPDFSFYNPSGNQTFPSNATLGFRGLGPSIVLKPAGDIGMRTGADCSVTFRPEVVDYDDNPVCAPEGGSIDNDCSGGDTSRISFSTDTLKVVNTVPSDGSVGVSLSGSGFMLVALNANVDIDSVSAITLTANGVDVPITPEIGDDKTAISFALAQDFEPDSTYVLTVTTALTDLLGGPLATESVSTWTTAGLELADTTPNDGSTNVAPGVIELDFNGSMDPATLAAITMTKNGTPTGDGTPAADGVAVVITPTLDPMDASIVDIDLGTAYEINTYYEVVVTTAIRGADGGMIMADELLTFTTETFNIASSTPADNDADVPVAGGDILLTFNVPVDAATVAAMTLTADTVAVTVTPVVQADPRDVVINVGAAFDAGAAYELTLGTGLQEVGGTALAADIVINWTTAN